MSLAALNRLSPSNYNGRVFVTGVSELRTVSALLQSVESLRHDQEGESAGQGV